MKKIQLGNMVRVKDCGYKDWDGKRGEVVAIVKESAINSLKRKNWKEYIIQFSQPFTWSYFQRKELRWDE